MAFMKHELDLLKKQFPFETADLENDFDSEELDAMDLGVLKGNPHFYLGNIFNSLIIFQKSNYA